MWLFLRKSIIILSKKHFICCNLVLISCNFISQRTLYLFDPDLLHKMLFIGTWLQLSPSSLQRTWMVHILIIILLNIISILWIFADAFNGDMIVNIIVVLCSLCSIFIVIEALFAYIHMCLFHILMGISVDISVVA